MSTEKQKLAVVAVAIFIIGEIFAFVSIFLIYFNRQFFSDHIDIIKTYVNASTAFFGCFFSVLSALLVFQFLRYQERRKEIKQTQLLFDKLKNEYDQNYMILTELGNEITSGSAELGRLLKESPRVRELFILAVYRLDFSLFVSHYHQTDWQSMRVEDKYRERYLELFEQTHKINLLCRAIIEREVDTIETLTQVVTLITAKITELKDRQAIIEGKVPSLFSQEPEYLTESIPCEVVQE